MIKVRGLVLFALSLMVLLVLTGGFSLYGDIQENARKTAEAESFVAGLSTPRECLEAYVRAYVEEDEYLLEALHADKDLLFDFDYQQDDLYPTGLISLEPVPYADDTYSAYEAVLEFRYEDGTLARLPCFFLFRRAEESGVWQIVSWGF